MVKDSFKYPLTTLDQMPRDPAECRSSFSSASAGPTWPIKFWTSQRLEISQPLCHPPWSSSFTGISRLLTTKHELLLPSLLTAASCSFSVPSWEKLGFISPSPTHWRVEKQSNSPLSCLLFSRWIQRRSLRSLSLPATLSKVHSSFLIMLTAPVHPVDQVGGNIIPSYTISQCKTALLPYHQLLPITCTQECFCHCLHRAEFSLSRAGAAEQSQAQSTGRKAAVGRADLQPG